MSSHKTTNLQLHRWDAADSFLRTEFNENFTSIDTALAAEISRAKSVAGNKASTASLLNLRSDLNAKIVVGAYTGDGTVDRIISLGFTPQALILCRRDGAMYTSYACFGGIAFQGHPGCVMYGASAFEIVNGGFRVTHATASPSTFSFQTNVNNTEYYYIAVR